MLVKSKQQTPACFPACIIFPSSERAFARDSMEGKCSGPPLPEEMSSINFSTSSARCLHLAFFRRPLEMVSRRFSMAPATAQTVFVINNLPRFKDYYSKIIRNSWSQTSITFFIRSFTPERTWPWHTAHVLQPERPRRARNEGI